MHNETWSLPDPAGWDTDGIRQSRLSRQLDLTMDRLHRSLGAETEETLGRGWCEPPNRVRIMEVIRSVGLFVLAAVAEIGGAWLVWQGVREHRGVVWVGAGIIALGLYGFVATLQSDPHFGRILAAYGGIFVAGSLAWGMALDGFRPDRYDIAGAFVCLVGVAIIMYAPRPAT